MKQLLVERERWICRTGDLVGSKVYVHRSTRGSEPEIERKNGGTLIVN
jgi:hypothetical protein